MLHSTQCDRPHPDNHGISPQPGYQSAALMGSSIIKYRQRRGNSTSTGDRHELTSTDHSYQGDETYNYDATGNRTDNTTGDHNRLLEDGTDTYEYDHEGNRTRRVETA
ncbi:MAG: hypothetical protein AAGH67_10470 [Cyanobacteria bacterium P01_H01_bin.162]